VSTFEERVEDCGQARVGYDERLRGFRSLLADVQLTLADVESSKKDRGWDDLSTLNVAYEDLGSVLGCLQVLAQ